jgi:DNA repair protein RadC
MNIKLTKEQKIKAVNTPQSVYSIMQRILLRENKIDRNREHFWTISLDTANKILNIELVSMGTVNAVLVEPMEVFSVPLQKRAVNIILVHNHPSGEVKPSEADKEITDRLIQVGRIINIQVIEHLIITEKSYYSFADSGLLKRLELSLKYVPAYEIKEQSKKEMARVMKRNGEPIEKIIEYTGLTKAIITKLKAK